jgi:hypothetical protein
MGDGKGRAEVVQWRKWLYINLWLVEMQFRWLSPKCVEKKVEAEAVQKGE